MPVILNTDLEEEWISGETSLLKRKKILQAYNESDLKAYTVTPRLSSSMAEPSDPHMIEPYEQLSPGKLF